MTMLARLYRIVALWWRSRRWVECSECGVTLTADERAHGREWGVTLCDDCRELAPKPLYRDPSQWRPGMVIPLPPRTDFVALGQTFIAAQQQRQSLEAMRVFLAQQARAQQQSADQGGVLGGLGRNLGGLGLGGPLH